MKNKLISPKQALALSNQNLVVVSGVFDVLHLGHINFLKNAKKLAKDSKLFVIIHSDRIVKKIKGEKRPYVNEKDRAEVLSELIVVDYVLIWDGWESICDFVLSLRPKYLAQTEKSFEHSKNNRWEGKTWEEVAKLSGSKLIKIRVLKNFSSSKLISLLENQDENL